MGAGLFFVSGYEGAQLNPQQVLFLSNRNPRIRFRNPAYYPGKQISTGETNSKGEIHIAERKWQLGEDLILSDNLLDGLTFDDLIMAVQCNSRNITPSAVLEELKEMLKDRHQDMMYLLNKNMDAIMAEARKGRGQ